MPHAQSAIIAPTGRYGCFISFKLNDSPTALATVRATAHRLASMVASINSQYSDHDLVASIAFGNKLCHQLFKTPPKQIKPFTSLGHGHNSAPASDADLFFHCHANSHDINFLLCQNLLAALADSVRVIDETSGFLFLDERDLTGFIDGTETPKEEQERREVALISDEDEAFSNGSYVLAMRFIHDLEKWQSLDNKAQEKVIGRTKEDSIELDEEALPDNAHISRVVIEEDGEELEIVRHSMPYGQASGDKGLFFLAYSKRLDIYEKMLAHMYGNSDDGIQDHLMEFSQAVSGAYFFAPSQSLLDSWNS